MKIILLFKSWSSVFCLSAVMSWMWRRAHIWHLRKLGVNWDSNTTQTLCKSFFGCFPSCPLDPAELHSGSSTASLCFKCPLEVCKKRSIFQQSVLQQIHFHCLQLFYRLFCVLQHVKNSSAVQLNVVADAVWLYFTQFISCTTARHFVSIFPE